MTLWRSPSIDDNQKTKINFYHLSPRFQKTYLNETSIVVYVYYYLKMGSKKKKRRFKEIFINIFEFFCQIFNQGPQVCFSLSLSFVVAVYFMFCDNNNHNKRKQTNKHETSYLVDETKIIDFDIFYFCSLLFVVVVFILFFLLFQKGI